MPKPYSKLLLTTILLATLLAPSATSVDWPVDGGDSQHRWYKPTYYDTNGNENTSTYNLGCTINRFYTHDNTLYAECANTIHKIQLTHPNLTYQGNLTITGDMLGILQGKIIANAPSNGLRAYHPNGTIAWTAGNITYYKWNNTDYVPTTYTPSGSNYAGGWLTENHAYVYDTYSSGSVLRAYDQNGNGIGLFTCGKLGYGGGHSWTNIAEDDNYLTAKCKTQDIYGPQNWQLIATYDLRYTLYDDGYTQGSYCGTNYQIRGATKQSLKTCTPTIETTKTTDAKLMLGSNQKIQFYGLSNYLSNEPDARNYLNYDETIDNTTNYGSRACYDETNWYEITNVNLTKWTVPRTNPIWTVTVNPYPSSGNPICLENVVLVTNSSGAALAIDKQTGTTQTAINMYTANQIIITGANTVVTTSGTKIHYTNPRTTTILKPDLTITKITWQKT